MLIRNIEGATRRMAKKQKEYITLPIRDQKTIVDGVETNYMVSAWEPTPKELDLLRAGGVLVNSVYLQAGECTGSVKVPDDEEIDRLRRGASVLLAVPGKIHPPVVVFVIDRETFDSVEYDSSHEFTVLNVGDI